MKIYKIITAQANKPIQPPCNSLINICWMSPQADLYHLLGNTHEKWVIKNFPSLVRNPVEALLFNKWVRVTYIGRDLMLQVARSSFLTNQQKRKAVEIAFAKNHDRITLDIWNGGDRIIWEKDSIL